MRIVRNPRKKPGNQRDQIKRTDPWEVLIIKDVRTWKIRRIGEGSGFLQSFLLKDVTLFENDA